MAVRLFVLMLCCLGVLCVNQSRADGPADNDLTTVRRIPTLGIDVPAERETQLREKLGTLQQKISELKQDNGTATPELVPDVMIFERAVRCALDYQEFFAEAELNRADKLLDEGIARAEDLKVGKLDRWTTPGQLAVRGYVSKIDNTVQPYGLVLPSPDLLASRVPLRCDLWFHGRGETLSELNFIWDRMNKPGEYTPSDTIVLHPYGRYSNAFKFAGEVDVLESLDDVKRRYRIDEDRIAVRGFSMGGAACWQLATHYSDRWFAANPGAGFSETPRFLETFQSETLNPTPWQRELWNWYDCDRYAVNLAQCPTIAYSGEIDRQKQAADVMEEALAEHGIRLKHVIGEGMGHKMDAASKLEIEAAMKSLAARGRQTMPMQIRFETYTLKYNRMHWLAITGMQQHWKRAHVDATLSVDHAANTISIGLDASNVTGIDLSFPAGSFSDLTTVPKVKVSVEKTFEFEVDGPTSDGALEVSLSRSEVGTWHHAVNANESESLKKRHGLQGPIDDALMDSFVFVRPTGTSPNAKLTQWADAELERAIEHWRRHFRGDARVVNDVDVTQELADSANLILWGDPASNSVLGKLASKLPIEWSGEKIAVGSQSFPASNHAAIMVYPNPMNANRYVVLNSSFTFREYAYLNNARQVPMLPDWAIVNLDSPPTTIDPGDVVLADFFDESWKLK